MHLLAKKFSFFSSPHIWFEHSLYSLCKVFVQRISRMLLQNFTLHELNNIQYSVANPNSSTVSKWSELLFKPVQYYSLSLLCLVCLHLSSVTFYVWSGNQFCYHQLCIIKHAVIPVRTWLNRLDQSHLTVWPTSAYISDLEVSDFLTEMGMCRWRWPVFYSVNHTSKDVGTFRVLDCWHENILAGSVNQSH